MYLATVVNESLCNDQQAESIVITLIAYRIITSDFTEAAIEELVRLKERRAKNFFTNEAKH